MTPLRKSLSSLGFSATNNVLEPHCKTYAIISRKWKGRGGWFCTKITKDTMWSLTIPTKYRISFSSSSWPNRFGGKKKFSFCTLLTTNNHFPIVGENKGGLRWGHFYCLLREATEEFPLPSEEVLFLHLDTRRSDFVAT